MLHVLGIVDFYIKMGVGRHGIAGLKDVQYGGNFILQTARAVECSHEQALARNLAWTKEQLELYFGP